MSSMAKIFVVVNLVFAIVAFGSAATLLGAQDDYRKGFEDKIAELKQFQQTSQQTIDDLEVKNAQQTNKAAEERVRADGLQQQIDELKTTLTAANTANDTLRSSVETFSKELATANQLNTANKEFLERLSSDAKRATEEMLNAKSTLDKEIGNRVGLEQQVAELGDQVQTLAADKGDLDKKLREAEFWLGKYRTKYGDIRGSEGAKGIVNAVKGNLVGISVGSADRVKVGDVYSLSRGTAYVGRITITQVDKNQSVGLFDDKWPGSGAPPQNGDAAAPSSGE
jgi:chromosome segregation ATPase